MKTKIDFNEYFEDLYAEYISYFQNNNRIKIFGEIKNPDNNTFEVVLKSDIISFLLIKNINFQPFVQQMFDNFLPVVKELLKKK